jgi:hypothetical protein
LSWSIVTDLEGVAAAFHGSGCAMRSELDRTIIRPAGAIRKPLAPAKRATIQVKANISMNHRRECKNMTTEMGETLWIFDKMNLQGCPRKDRKKWKKVTFSGHSPCNIGMFPLFTLVLEVD